MGKAREGMPDYQRHVRDAKGTVPFMNRLERTLIGSNICHDIRHITWYLMFTLCSNIKFCMFKFIWEMGRHISRQNIEVTPPSNRAYTFLVFPSTKCINTGTHVHCL